MYKTSETVVRFWLVLICWSISQSHTVSNRFLLQNTKNTIFGLFFKKTVIYKTDVCWKRTLTLNYAHKLFFSRPISIYFNQNPQQQQPWNQSNVSTLKKANKKILHGKVNGLAVAILTDAYENSTGPLFNCLIFSGPEMLKILD